MNRFVAIFIVLLGVALISIAALPMMNGAEPTDKEGGSIYSVLVSFDHHTYAVNVQLYDNYLEGYHNSTIPRFMSTFAYYRYITPDDPTIKDIATQLLLYGSDMSDLDKVSLANAFVHTAVTYKNDEGALLPEYLQYPAETLERGLGDCEDHAILLTSILRAMGYDAVTVTMLGQQHVAVGVALEGGEHSFTWFGKEYCYVESTSGAYAGYQGISGSPFVDDMPWAILWIIIVLLSFGFLFWTLRG
ncbi:MAG: transglutaminase domain-containing protein [Candidatus Methanomethylophilaceae archaeon]|nr:transglutaminase domain-containing protein [Candidatus Methanomethylophilaceae archaeon]